MKKQLTELKQEIRATKVNETGEHRVFDEAIQRMAAELKQEIRSTKVNETGEHRVFDEVKQQLTALRNDIVASLVVINQTGGTCTRRVFHKGRVK